MQRELWVRKRIAACFLFCLMGLADALLPSGCFAAEMPLAVRVETQPLLAQIRRLRETLAFLGEPLPLQTQQKLDTLARQANAKATTRAIEKLLDPLCLVAVRIRQGKPLQATANPSRPALVEQGWRLCLIKVVNDAGVTSPLLLKSDNARPLPESPRNEVSKRWLALETYHAPPMYPELSGLGLEYRIVQIYSRKAGSNNATLQFAVKQNNRAPLSGQKPKASGSIRQWTFGAGASGWKALSDCRLSVEKGVLTVHTTNIDPYMAAPLSMPGGKMRFRMRFRIDHEDVGQLFWATQEHPQFSGARQAVFALNHSGEQWQECSVPFDAEGDLTQFRLDLGGAAGRVEIAWIEISNEDGAGTVWTPLAINFRCVPSYPVRFRVQDEQGKPTTAGFSIRDAQGRVYPPQAKRLAPDFHFQTQIYRADGETVRLPSGVYTVVCRRGPESITETKTLTVGAKSALLTYRVKRWIDPAKSGWWSGDHHIHAAGCAHYSNPTQGVLPADMMRHCIGEDLKVGCNLTWGPCFDFQKQFFTGTLDKVSHAPYLLRYDIEVSGFGSHQSGHLCLLRLNQQIPPGGNSTAHWWTLGLNTLRWAKKQGAVCGTAHSAIGLSGSVGRVAEQDGPGGLPSYSVPPFDGIGAMEYIVDVTHEVEGQDGKPTPAIDFLATMDTDRLAELNIWYHTLNCGYRTRISGETDFPCISGERVGKGRSYVHLTGALNFDAWCEGIRAGSSYVSDGQSHLLDFRLNGQRVGEDASEVRLSSPGKVRLTANVAVGKQIPLRAETPSQIVEVVVNGYPVAQQSLIADGRTRPMTFDIPMKTSGWIALRILGSSHTNPFFVLLGDKPIRANRRSALWCLQSVDQCWKQKERFIADAEKTEAQQAYDHARQAYRRILSETTEE